MTTSSTTPPLSESRPIYVERVNAVIDYIEAHLADDLTLGTLAEVAHFSPYHFHRVFSTMVGETLSRFISRLRVERAATLLVQHPNRAITDVAIDCGFTNPSSFARAFRDTFGMSASEWRTSGFAAYEREPGGTVRDVIGNLGLINEEYDIIDAQLAPAAGRPTWTVRAGTLGPVTVTVEKIPALNVAYVRHTGRYQGLAEVFADLFTRLMTWAQPRGLVRPDSQILSVYHDNPSITEDDRLRVSACITVPPGTETSGDVGQMIVEGGRFAVGHFTLGDQDYGEAWYSLAGGWLPWSGYEPDDRHPYERYPLDESDANPDKRRVDICLPVRPLRRY
ncbi:MAG: GyrI-like domain-containing protein [Acidimicrobiia bacterium]